ncbi:MAG: polyphosphate kinase [Verrucomicrobiia bacterium Tous-C3TDCM]|jgi:PPK2 family polyphosphate:nucleotide phosphotransferase|nr:MAG: polyphosphate kinase [Verrucomicrobiae bacterium Tous-C3TDCM]PAZ05159.1 MAG: polyphosphate kinase [Verrucomicrobiae bacterium AMD-G2]
MKLLEFAPRYLVKYGTQLNLSEVDADELEWAPSTFKSLGERKFEKLRDEIQSLQKVLYAQGMHRILIILQAMDTGGKDGCVKHVFSRVDPQGINVKAFKKPSEEELAHDFLWRVHPHVPGNGQIAIFNRSHYEDIISVKVKKLRPDEVWKKRYRHIVDFERMLVDEGTTIVKFFLHISPDEQKSRLLSRLRQPEKHWKLNPDDIQDRSQWGEFMAAYEEMIGRTSTNHAPWYVVPANRKWYRNLVVAQIVVEHLRALNMKYPQPTWDPGSIVIE